MAKNHQGYIVIYSVVIIGAVVAAMIFSASQVSLSSIKSSRLLVDSKQSKALANACAETTLQNIRDNINYSGSGNLNMGEDTCSYTIVNQDGQSRLVQAESAASGAISKIEILIDQINPQINIASWQEVSDF